MDVVKRLLDSRLFWIVCGVLLFGSIANMAHRQLLTDARFLARPAFAGARIPPWADRPLLQPVIDRMEALGPVSLLDPDFEAKIRGALADCPVVARVTGVERDWPRSYALKVVFRRPVAVLEQGDRRVPVTADGVRLPAEPYDCRPLYVITGVPGPLPDVGETIACEELADGIATLRQLAPHLPHLRRLDIRAIDVSEAARARGGVVLRTGHGIPVRWGRPRMTLAENPVERKIDYLLAAQDHLDALDGYVIDVRYDEPYVRESPSP